MDRALAVQAIPLPAESSPRYAYIDTARISLMVLGVLFHAATMFSISDDSFVKFDTREQLIGQLAGVVHIFRMEAFFILAAFLGTAMLDRYGSEKFLEKRTLRLLPPFITGLFIQYLSAAHLKGQPLIDDYPSVQYLWFLPVLLAIALLQQQLFPPKVLNRLLPTTIKLMPWIAVPALTTITALFCLGAECGLKFVGVEALTQATAGAVTGGNLAHFLPIYIVGAALYSRRNCLESIFKVWPTLIPLALFNFSGLSILYEQHVSKFAQILSALALTGIVVAVYHLYVPDRWAKKWMSNFSFTLYLLHQPLLCVLRLPIMDAVHNTYARFFILVTATTAICAVLHYAITKSFVLGFFFNGETKASSRPAPTLQTASVA